MANIEEAIRRLKYLYEVHGAEQVTAAQAAITASTTGTERAALSLEKSFNSLERKYVATVRHQQDYKKELDKANDALKQNPALQQRYNVILENMNQHYANAAKGANTYGKALDQTSQQGRLARHELINLSRQIQDVGVGIVSGQSPFTILVQQGAQIADVFATSTGTLAGFFKQAGAGAARFATSAAGIGTGVAALGGAIVYASASFTSGQRDINRSLMGIGQAAGVTRDQINKIGQTSSSAFGLSRSEAEQAASAFAATGKIYGQNVGQATRLIDDFVRAGGDATEVTKELAKALVDPAKGALDLNKQYGFLTVSTLEYIRALQGQGKLQEAQAVLMEEATPKIQEQAKNIGWLRKEWNAAGNDLSNFMRWVGRAGSRDFERITGIAAGGFSMDEQLAEAKERLARAQPIPGQAIPLVSRKQLQEAEADVRRLEKAMADLAKAPAAERLRVLGLEVDAIKRAIIPATAEIDKMQAALSKLRQHREQTGGPITGAEQVGDVRLRELQEQEAATVRVAQATSTIAQLYPGMSLEVGKQLRLMEDQLVVAEAFTGQQQIAAKEQATYSALRLDGKTHEEALAVAASQRAITEAQINSQVKAQNVALYNQLQVSSAVGGLNQINAQYEATIANLTAQGVEHSVAAANAELQRANAIAQVNAQSQDTTNQLRRQLPVAQAITGAERIRAQETATINQLMDQGVSKVNALAQAAAQRAVAEAQAISAIEQQVQALENQTQLLNTRSAAAESAVKVEQAYEAALRASGDTAAANAVAQATADNENARRKRELWQAEERAGDRRRQQIEAEQRAWDEAAKKAGDFATAMEIQHILGGGKKNESSGRPGLTNVLTDLGRWMKQQVESGKSEFFEGGVGPFALRNTAAYDKYLAEASLLQSGQTPAQVLQQKLQSPLKLGGFGEEGQANQQQLELLNRLIDLIPEEGQAAAYEQMLAKVRENPVTLQREELIKDLNDKLEQLKDSTDDLNDSMNELLSPYYATDPRLSKIGFRSDSGPFNPDRYLTEEELGKRTIVLPKPTTAPTPTIAPPGIGPNPSWGRFLPGMANGGSMTVPGGYSRNDNFLLPVRSGERINVNTPERGRSVNITAPININIHGPTDKNTARETGFQVQRAMRRVVLGRG